MNRSAIPTPAQLAFQDWEFGLFFHFGIRTFYEGHWDWDGQPMDPAGFRPTQLDCRQWANAAKEAGATYAVLVAKHHDGFANWPSQYSTYTVAQTPWRDGCGDVVAEFTTACREAGLKVGLYYSPAQQGFREWTAKEYDDYFINQITELLTNYGRVDYLWFDGCGSGDHVYDTERIVGVIRSLQPEILIFNLWDPDTRWVGNESGVAGLDNRSYVRSVDIAVDTAVPQQLSEGCYLPAECDCCIRGHTWFYSDRNEADLKSPEELFGLYCASVGNNANLLLNVGPDRRGLLPEADTAVLSALGKKIRCRLQDAVCSSGFVREGESWVCRLAQGELVSGVILEEDLSRGELFGDFRLEVRPADGSRPLPVFYGKAVGHKRICLFPPVRTALVRFVPEAPPSEASLKAMSILREP